MRLDKYLADCGAGSRSEIKKLIRGGDVRVFGIDKLKPDMQIDEKTAEVSLRGKKLIYRKFIYLMLNKPQGYLSATWDARQPVVLDLVPEEFRHYKPFPAGRLDIDTEGLCLITNDGELAHKITSPAHHIPKTYIAVIDKEINYNDIKAFKEGIVLDDGYKTKPAELRVIEENENPLAEVIITEGKFHQIKRMFEALDKKVLYLKRTAMNRLVLDEWLKPGELRELTADEVGLLETGDK